MDRAAHTPAAPTQSQASGRAEGRQGLSPENWLVLMQLLKITTITQVHFKLCLPCPQCDFLQISKAVGMPARFTTVRGGSRTCPVFISSFAANWDSRVTVQFAVCRAPGIAWRENSGNHFRSSFQSACKMRGGGPQVTGGFLGDDRNNRHHSSKRAHPGPGAQVELFLIFRSNMCKRCLLGLFHRWED